MNNKLDPVHAVASLSLAFIEVQKELSQLRRQFDIMYNQLHQVDQGVASKFKELDSRLEALVLIVQGGNHATNIQGEENPQSDDQAVRSEEG